MDKLLFAVSIAIARFIGNFIFEGYKSDLAVTQFLLDKRLEALKDLRISFSNLGQHAFIETYNSEQAKPEMYNAEVFKFLNLINRWGFLFSNDLTLELNHYAWLHQAAASPEVVQTHEYYGFMVAISEAFDASTRRALNVEVLGAQPETEGKAGYFHVRVWKQEDVWTKGTEELFDDNFRKWQQEYPNSSASGS